jgi:heme-degrading monooxygenase HmoA
MTSTFKKPYYTVVVCSQHAAKPHHKGTSSELIGRVKKHPGFLGYESARDDNGHTVTVSYWQSVKSIKDWKAGTDHKRQAAARKGGGGAHKSHGGVYKSIGK